MPQAAILENNIHRANSDIQRLSRAINQNSLARLAVILGGGALLSWSFQTENVAFVCGSAMSIVLLFVFLVGRQGRLEKRREERRAFLRVNENEIELRETGRTMYAEGGEFEDGKHAYTSDLDVFGSRSLFALLNRCATRMGVLQLAGWLDRAAPKAEIIERQEASAEIARDMEWSQALQAKLLFNLDRPADPKAFLRGYFKDAALSFGNRFMRVYVPAAPFLLLAGALYSFFVSPVWGAVLGLSLLHLCWTLLMAGKVGLFSARIDKIGRVLTAYAEAVELIENRDFAAAMNRKWQAELLPGGTKLSVAFRELSRLMDSLDARNNIPVGAVMNMLLLWDFKYVMKIVDWKKKHADGILIAFDAVAVFEALNSLAVLRRNRPDWATPELLDSPVSDSIRAVDIGHPLIRTDVSVPNDYAAEGHAIALITGSNMAGKSTFLRTISTNAVLAYAGAVTCGRSFSLPIYRLVSYMRIKDSLSESTSTFKAELDRVKLILDTVEQDRSSFFLVDEMLRGTNSVDKYRGSRAIIKKLIAQDGKGIVATHDLQLASLAAEHPGKVVNYHFDIQVRDGEMLFDYKLKPGECTVFNASMLLKGIGVSIYE